MNGSLVNQSDAKVSVFDHGLLYGDGLFEGIRAYNGKIFLCKDHIDRLFEGAHYVNLEIPFSKEEMKKALEDTIQANNLKMPIFALSQPADLVISALTHANVPEQRLLLLLQV